MGICRLKKWRYDSVFQGKKKTAAKFVGDLEFRNEKSKIWEFSLWEKKIPPHLAKGKILFTETDFDGEA